MGEMEPSVERGLRPRLAETTTDVEARARSCLQVLIQLADRRPTAARATQRPALLGRTLRGGALWNAVEAGTPPDTLPEAPRQRPTCGGRGGRRVVPLWPSIRGT